MKLDYVNTRSGRRHLVIDGAPGHGRLFLIRLERCVREDCERRKVYVLSSDEIPTHDTLAVVGGQHHFANTLVVWKALGGHCPTTLPQ